MSTPQDSRAPSPALVAGLMVLMSLVWGSTWLAIKIGLDDVPPFTAAAVRFTIAGACMIVLARVLLAREGGAPPPRSAVLTHGLFQFALNFGIVYVAETVLPSGMVAVLWAVYPLFVALGEHFVLKTERLSPRKWLGITVSFLGVVLLFATDLAAVDAQAIPMGLLVLLAPLSVTVSTLVIKKSASGSSSLLLNRDAMWLGAGMLACAAFMFEAPLEVTWTARAIASVLYLALVGTVVTFSAYQWMLRYVAAYRLSLVSFVIPVVALILGAAFGGEPVGMRTLLGAGLVLGGLALALVRRS
jgi:drug/metabolite transporter (DMT)-like permease